MKSETTHTDTSSAKVSPGSTHKISFEQRSEPLRHRRYSSVVVKFPLSPFQVVVTPNKRLLWVSESHVSRFQRRGGGREGDGTQRRSMRYRKHLKLSFYCHGRSTLGGGGGEVRDGCVFDRVVCILTSFAPSTSILGGEYRRGEQRRLCFRSKRPRRIVAWHNKVKYLPHI